MNTISQKWSVNYHNGDEAADKRFVWNLAGVIFNISTLWPAFCSLDAAPPWTHIISTFHRIDKRRITSEWWMLQQLKAATLNMCTGTSVEVKWDIWLLFGEWQPGFTCGSSRVAGMGQMWVNTGLLCCIRINVVYNIVYSAMCNVLKSMNRSSCVKTKVY